MTRRRWLKSLSLGGPSLACAHAGLLEPTWLSVTRHRLPHARLGKRIVHLTDIHHKGDEDYLGTVVAEVNRLKPDAVCFTGDLIEEAPHLESALAQLARVEAPLYGLPGNHDHWSGANLERCVQVFRKQGGRWIPSESCELFEGGLVITGCEQMQRLPSPRPDALNLLMVHYPEFANHTRGQRFDLILAGHTHGGQVRLPFLGALVTPFATGGYEKGWYQTPGGPLYVNPGIGYFYLNVRFFCRPEITVIEV